MTVLLGLLEKNPVCTRRAPLSLLVNQDQHGITSEHNDS